MNIPNDDNNYKLQLTPAVKSTQSRIVAVTSTATDLTLNSETRIIRILSNGDKTYLKYGTSATIADDGFDEIIPDGMPIDLVIDENTTGFAISLISSGTPSIDLIEKK